MRLIGCGNGGGPQPRGLDGIVGWCVRLGFGTSRRGGLAPCLRALSLRV